MYSTNRRRVVVSAMMFGLSQSVIYFVYTATFIFGAWLIDTGDMDFLNVLRVFSTVTFSAMSLGRAIGYAPDYTKGRLSAAKMFALLDRAPAIDVRSTKGKALVSITLLLTLNTFHCFFYIEYAMNLTQAF